MLDYVFINHVMLAVGIQQVEYTEQLCNEPMTIKAPISMAFAHVEMECNCSSGEWYICN